MYVFSILNLHNEGVEKEEEEDEKRKREKEKFSSICFSQSFQAEVYFALSLIEMH